MRVQIFCFWVQVKIKFRVRSRIRLMEVLAKIENMEEQLRMYLQRWFLDTRVGRLHRWRKSQCDHELLSVQMLHTLKTQKQTLLTMFITEI